MGLVRARSAFAFACAAIVGLVIAGVVGYLIGHGDRSSVFKVGPGLVYVTRSEGTAYLGPNQPLHSSPRGFAYGISPDIPWIDASGVSHEGDHASCLPYDHASRVKRMETVQYPIGNAYQGLVLWVQC
jgi:hypothetical protein